MWLFFFYFFDLRLNKRLSKQSWGWWLKTLSRPLWRHRNDCAGKTVSLHWDALKLKSRLRRVYFLFTQSFWKIAQCMAMTLPCFLEDFKTIGQQKRVLWANEISRDLGLTRVSDGYSIQHNALVLFLLCDQPGVLYNIRYPSETHLKFKSREISFVHKTHVNCPIVLNFCTAVLLPCSVQNFKKIK